MNDYSEITATLYQRHQLMLKYAREKKYFDAMMCAGTLSLHLDALAHEFQRLARVNPPVPVTSE